MNDKNMIIAGAIAIGIYLFSQGKAIFSAATQKVAQKVDISILQVQWLRYMIAHAAAFKITGKEVAVLKAEVARREAAWKAAHKTAPKRVGQPTTRAAYIAAAQKAAARKKIRREAARKIGKIIGKKVAQKVVPRISEETGGRTGMALYIYLKKKAGGMRAALTQAVKAARTGSKIILPSSKWAGGRTGMALAIYLKKRVIALEQAAKQAKAAITRPPITRTAYIAAAQKAAAQKKIRQEAAQKIGKIIGKKVAQKVVPRVLEETGGRTGMALYIYLKKKAAGMRAAVTQAVNAARTGRILPFSRLAGGRTGMALAIFLKKRAIALEQAAKQAKAAITRPTSKLFPGAERSRIIPYSESSRHSYYGPKSHRLQNEGYGKGKAERDRKQALEFRLNELRALFPSSNL